MSIQPKIITVGGNQGLPNEQVHTITNDKFGRLWIAGPLGLSCYNGNTIRNFDTRDGLKCPGLRTISITKHDIIWIGTDSGIEAMTIDGTILDLKLNFEWTFGIADSFLIIDTIIWVGTSFGLLKLENKNQELNLLFCEDIGLVTNIIYNGVNSILAISSKKGVVEYTNDSIIKFAEDILLNQKPISLFKTIDSCYLIGTLNGLFFLNKDRELKGHYISDSEPSKVTAINSIGNEWVIAMNKTITILKYSNSCINELEIINIESVINSILIDEFKNIWVSTNNSGLKKISYLRKILTPIETGSNSAAFCIKNSPSENKTYLGGDGFFSIISKKEKEEKPRLLKHFKLPTIVWDVLKDPVDSSLIWLATQNGLYTSQNNSQPVKAPLFTSIINSPNRVVLARENEIWIGTISGLFCIKNGLTTEILNNKGGKFGYVYCLSLNHKNNIWVGTLGQGLWLESEDGFFNVNDHLITKQGNTYSIVSNEFGNTIVIQQEKIIIIDLNLVSKLVYITYPQAGWTAVWINHDTIATGSSEGIRIFDTNKNTLKHQINLHLDRSDWEFTCSRSLFYNHENETLYCGLNSGVYLINYSQIIKNLPMPEIHLDKCVWQNIEPHYSNQQCNLIVGKWSVELTVFSTWFIDKNQLKFRFKLIGFDETWTELRPSGRIKYNSLPIGKYELLAQAFTPITGFGAPKSILKFNVKYTVSSTLNRLRKNISSFFGLWDESFLKNEFLLNQNELLKAEIAERKKVETELTTYKEQLEELVTERTSDLFIEKEKAQLADKMKSAFLANMSHEIRNPLGGIIGINHLLEETKLDPIQKDYVHKIDNSAEHLLQIINDILDISKIESGKFELETIPFSLDKLLAEVGEFSQTKMTNSLINVLIDNQKATNNLLIGDPLRLKQVLFNLVSNSLKFTKKGNIVIEVKEQQILQNKLMLQFVVSDTGIGMNEKQVKSLFKAFNQGDASISRNFGGTGLGLNISYKFIELMGGVLSATSKPNLGTSFLFSLEFDTIENNKSTSELPVALKTLNVLLIDKDKLSSKINTSFLTSLGLNTVVSPSIFEAVTVIEENKFDLIFVDWTTTENKDIELLHLNKDSAKIILVGSVNKDLLLINAPELDIKKVILKPLNKKIIYDTITQLYTKTKQEEAQPISKTFNNLNNNVNNQFNILVAEDNLINQLVIKKMLEKEGLNVKLTANGQQCIDALIENSEFDLIFMDIRMPLMDGIKTTKYIRKKLKNNTIPIIALTADVTMETRNNIGEYGMNSYLSKPILLKDLHEILNKWLPV